MSEAAYTLVIRLPDRRRFTRVVVNAETSGTSLRRLFSADKVRKLGGIPNAPTVRVVRRLLVSGSDVRMLGMLIVGVASPMLFPSRAKYPSRGLLRNASLQ